MNEFAMTNESKQGICKQCQKPIVDLSEMTGEEIRAYLRKHPDTYCFRYSVQQIRTLERIDQLEHCSEAVPAMLI